MLFLFVSLVCSPAFAQNKSFVKISGSSNALDWSCQTEADLQIGSSGKAEPVSGFPNGVVNFKVTIPVAKLRCDKGKKMEEHMAKALKAVDQPKVFPEIVFEMTGYTLKNGNLASIVGNLTIAGKPQEVKFDVKLAELGNNAGVLVSGNTKVLMPDYGVKPPSLMMGTLNVYPEVTVEFEVTLSQPSS
jgi:hypothetical protein